MLLLVLVLVLIAFALLVFALLSGSVLSAWLAVGVSVVAGIVLLVDWLHRRAAVKAGAESDLTPPMAGGGDIDPVTEIFAVQPAAAVEPVRPAAAVDGVTTATPSASGDPSSSGGDGQQTMVLPTVRPFSSDSRPLGATSPNTPSGSFSSPSATKDVDDAPAAGSGAGARPAFGGSDVEQTVAVEARRPKVPAASGPALPAANGLAPAGPNAGGPTADIRSERVEPAADAVRPAVVVSMTSGVEASGEPAVGPVSAGAAPRRTAAASSAGSIGPDGVDRVVRLDKMSPGSDGGGSRPNAFDGVGTLAGGAAGWDRLEVRSSGSGPAGDPMQVAAPDTTEHGALNGSAPETSSGPVAGAARSPVDEPTGAGGAALGAQVDGRAPDTAPAGGSDRSSRFVAGSTPSDSSQSDSSQSDSSRSDSSRSASSPYASSEMAGLTTGGANGNQLRGDAFAVPAEPAVDTHDGGAPGAGSLAATDRPADAAGAGSTPPATAEDDDPPEEPVDPAASRIVSEAEDEVVVVDERPRYHLRECRALSADDLIPLPAREAVELGFTPCGWCRPDATLADRHRAEVAR